MENNELDTFNAPAQADAPGEISIDNTIDEIKAAIKARHSVRSYKPDPIPEPLRRRLDVIVREYRHESSLNIQIFYDAPECVGAGLFGYGKFKNAVNYISITGPDNDTVLETAGYYGQKLVLAAQVMGLNTCWIGGTFSRGKCKATVKPGEKIIVVISLGYGEDQGVAHRSKPLGKLTDVPEDQMPDWFRDGMEAALQAPTALNQQQFFVTLGGDGEADNRKPVITAKHGPFAKVDLGIVKCNFELASGHRFE